MSCTHLHALWWSVCRTAATRQLIQIAERGSKFDIAQVRVQLASPVVQLARTWMSPPAARFVLVLSQLKLLERVVNVW
jgi:hypothetical protein